MIGFGFVKNWTALVALRVVLGILEAGYFPGCLSTVDLVHSVLVFFFFLFPWAFMLFHVY